MPCKACGHKSLFRDNDTSSLICESCGAVQDFDSYEARTFSVNGPEGVFIRVGTSGTGSVLNYRDKKIFEANKLIDELAFRLDLMGQKVSEIKVMIDKITEGEYGQGQWFNVLIGACAYVTMRIDKKSLPIEEVSNVIGCDIHELGRMVMRVAKHLDIKLPEVDLVGSFERLVKNFAILGRVEGEKVERMRTQGVFLIQCSVKWFLTTGRRPLPFVVAVLVLVAELNGVEGLKIEDLAREVSVAVSTCRLRYKELLEVIVKVAAKVLPWGKDVTMKNAVKNAPFVIRYLEMKSMEKRGTEGEGLESFRYDLGDVIDECMRKDVGYVVEEHSGGFDDSRYFEVEDKSGFDRGIDDVDNLQLSHECLSMVYNNFKNMRESGRVLGRKRKRGFELHATEWWNGKSELSKKLLLKQILEKDVGLEVMPPSFINGCVANKRRREKINAAKLRIDRIKQPWNIESSNSSKECVVDGAHTEKRRRKSQFKDIDWEDFIIETLLLHQVNEEEIETGQYNTLLDLYVFNSGII